LEVDVLCAYGLIIAGYSYIPGNPLISQFFADLAVFGHNGGMDVQQKLEELRALTDYAYRLLKDSEGKRQYIYGREAYLAGLFASALAQTQGVICLADNKQYRVSKTLMRTLYEIWVNAKFIYCTRSFVYARVAVLISERNRLEKMEGFKSEGLVSQADYDKHKDHVKAMERFVARKYPAWPDTIPDVITSGTPVTRRKFQLKQYCQIIDFYNHKYNRGRKKSITMLKHYETLYPHFSGDAHADPAALSHAFAEAPGTQEIHVDIDGSSDPDEMARLCDAAFAFLYELTSMMKFGILKERPPRFSDDIEKIARANGLIR